MRCLRGGGAVAARYPGDLAAAEVLAASLPAAPPAPVHSRAGAELAVRVYAITLENNGCDGCGGQVHEGLLPVRWDGDPASWPDRSRGWEYYGTIAGVAFRAVFTTTDEPGRRQPMRNGWWVDLNAC